jgi:hypothetical protein
LHSFGKGHLLKGARYPIHGYFISEAFMNVVHHFGFKIAIAMDNVSTSISNQGLLMKNQSHPAVDNQFQLKVGVRFLVL